MTPVVTLAATAAELHAADPFTVGPYVEQPAAEVTLWWCRPTAAALVLGSRQSPSIVDHDACDRLGIDVVRRRSGGGAVLVEPATMVWIDIVVPRRAMPAGVPADDVRASMVWAGERWAAALAGPSGGEPLEVHRGGMLTGEWADLVCFAGIGPGEVLAGGRKLVGLSQRRTRHGMRIQGLLHTASARVAITDLFVPGVVPDVVPGAAPPPPATLAVDPELVIAAMASGGDWG